MILLIDLFRCLPHVNKSLHSFISAYFHIKMADHISSVFLGS